MDVEIEDVEEPKPEVPMTILGLEADTYTDEPLGVPVEAMAIIKVLVDDHIEHRIATTEGLTSVEAMGMIQWADCNVKAAWATPVIVAYDDLPDDDDDEGGSD